jgi:hypothetical protein
VMKRARGIEMEMERARKKSEVFLS